MTDLSIDVQPVQSVQHPERGIARYTFELVTALAANHAESLAALVFNPDLPLPIATRSLAETQPLRSSDELRRGDGHIHLITSPFEGVHFDRILPPALRLGTAQVACVLYDLIPIRFADHYLRDPVARRRYWSRLELVRGAAAVLCPSEQTARDAHDLLGIGHRRIHVIKGAPSARFAEAGPSPDPLPPGVLPGHVLLVGGADWRKNLELVVKAYAELAPRLRADHQLVIVGRLGPRGRSFGASRSARGVRRNDLHRRRV